jgi:hypothetical protein
MVWECWLIWPLLGCEPVVDFFENGNLPHVSLKEDKF